MNWIIKLYSILLSSWKNDINITKLSLLPVVRKIWHKNIWFEIKLTDTIFSHFDATILRISTTTTAMIIIITIIIITL